jgi:hypothetical protein
MTVTAIMDNGAFQTSASNIQKVFEILIHKSNMLSKMHQKIMRIRAF